LQINILFILALEVNFTNMCLAWASLSFLLANLFMESIETFAMHRLSPCFWGRFLDDMVCIWKHGLESLDLNKTLNSLDKNVKFTVEFKENDKLPFLDILLIESDFHLLFSGYRKPTHIDRYLNFHSCHPISVKQGAVIVHTKNFFPGVFRF